MDGWIEWWGGGDHSQSPPVCRDKHREGPTARTGAYGRAWLTVLTFRKSTVNKVSQRINSRGSRGAHTHLSTVHINASHHCMNTCLQACIHTLYGHMNSKPWDTFRPIKSDTARQQTRKMAVSAAFNRISLYTHTHTQIQADREIKHAYWLIQDRQSGSSVSFLGLLSLIKWRSIKSEVLWAAYLRAEYTSRTFCSHLLATVRGLQAPAQESQHIQRQHVFNMFLFFDNKTITSYQW